MTREEEANKASKSYASQLCVFCLDEYCKEKGLTCPQFRESLIAFSEGVKWADEHPANVWHEASEKPRAEEWLLLQISEDSYLSMYLNKLAVDAWVDVFCNTLGVIRYAYIKNLLPKGGDV